MRRNLKQETRIFHQAVVMASAPEAEVAVSCYKRSTLIPTIPELIMLDASFCKKFKAKGQNPLSFLSPSMVFVTAVALRPEALMSSRATPVHSLYFLGLLYPLSRSEGRI